MKQENGIRTGIMRGRGRTMRSLFFCSSLLVVVVVILTIGFQTGNSQSQYPSNIGSNGAKNGNISLINTHLLREPNPPKNAPQSFWARFRVRTDKDSFTTYSARFIGLDRSIRSGSYYYVDGSYNTPKDIFRAHCGQGYNLLRARAKLSNLPSLGVIGAALVFSEDNAFQTYEFSIFCSMSLPSKDMSGQCDPTYRGKYVNRVYGYSVMIPTDRIAFGGIFYNLGDPESCSLDKAFTSDSPRIAVTADWVGPKWTLARAEEEFKWIATRADGSKLKEMESSAISVASHPARRVVMRYTVQSRYARALPAELAISAEAIILIVKGVRYTIELENPLGSTDSYRSEFDQVVKSFRLARRPKVVTVENRNR